MFRNPIWRRWTLACAAGEIIGIGGAALLATAHLLLLGEPETTDQKLLQLVFMMAAGFVEGSLLGWFQWRVLGKIFPALPSKSWISYTVAVAVIGWFLGMLPSLFLFDTGPAVEVPAEEPSLYLVLGFALLMGLCLGGLFGLFQWLSFKKYVQHTTSWIWANMLGWGVAMMVIFLAATWPDVDTPKIWVVVSGIVGGLLAGLSVGAITGVYLLRIIRNNT